ncbi:MAG: phosphoribosyl-ATP diphosphatase [Hyphomicrobiales bacterium]
MSKHRLEVLERLADTVGERAGATPKSSYTAKLLSQGTEKCAKKVGEEAVELALAAMTPDRDHLISETADLMYHLLVLLQGSGVPLSAVMGELERRMERGGLSEKAARKF